MAPSADGVGSELPERGSTSCHLPLRDFWAIVLKACQMAGCLEHIGCIRQRVVFRERREIDSSSYLMR